MELKEKFGDKRRTKVVKGKLGEITEVDLVPLEETIVTLTTGGYIKRINPATYKIQKRGGKGIMGMKTMQDDIVEHFICASTHDNLMFFTDSGKVFQTQVYEIPEGTRVARGRGVMNFLEMSNEEKVLSLIPAKKDEVGKYKYLVMITKNGRIKKTALEETIVTLTTGGYIKRINPTTYKIQKRGGKGIMGMKTMQDDIVEHFLTASTHDNLMFFTDSGKVFQTQVYEIPEGNRVARGRGLLNFLELSNEEKVLSLIPMPGTMGPKPAVKDGENKDKFLVMITKNGRIKKTALSEFENVRKSGIIAIKLEKGDALKKVVKTTGEDDIILATKNGTSIRFKEKDIRPMGRGAAPARRNQWPITLARDLLFCWDRRSGR